MKCPKCDSNSPLEVSELNACKVEVCKECHGIWLSAEALRKAKDYADPDLGFLDTTLWKKLSDFKRGKERYPCPKCSLLMYVLDYGDTGVTVDYCAPCNGVWLDSGEFAAIVSALEQEILTKPALEFAKESLIEAKEILLGPESLWSEWSDFSKVVRLLSYRVLVEHPGFSEFVKSVQVMTPFR